ncbi:calcium-binding protein [Streptomyces spectabilis]|uniref:Calcium-binding protein n=1 Tax=Streptomyces spectabilis TaxID=68270 RepID=A0A516R976_STRST|nr:calcium-binding protein [Streptomyces spectabilis]QDQ12203.1 calcium-binding protein [Streptomyces spectabilis]
MRIRTTVAAVSGAVVLSGLALPTAQAADSHKGHTKITKVVVNGGKDIVVGTADKKITMTVTGTDPKGIKDGFAALWYGKKLDWGRLDGMLGPAKEPRCTKIDAKSATCRIVTVAHPRGLKNSTAGTWNVVAGLLGKGRAENHVIKEKYKTVRVQRATRLTVNASPEPVKKGEAVTVSGALTRADWESRTYAAYTGQPVKLQFKAEGTSAYTTLKTLKTDAKGQLKTTVKASVDGSFRYVFGGSAASPAVTAAGDFVDVR